MIQILISWYQANRASITSCQAELRIKPKHERYDEIYEKADNSLLHRPLVIGRDRVSSD
jgi:hypothetical protein